MKNKILLFLRYVNRFGVFQGIKIFLSRQYFENIKFTSGNILTLRRGSSDGDVFNQVFVYKEYDIDCGNDVKFIIDAGANIGLTSLFFSNKYHAAKIISIEPERENFETLLKNCSSYNAITPLNKALWKDNEPVYLNKSESKDSHNIVDGSQKSDLVQTITIPDIIKQYNIDKIDILKLDIEGAEKEIFSNNVDLWLPKVKYLIIELHDRFLPGCSMSVFKALSNYNFSMSIKGELLVINLNN